MCPLHRPPIKSVLKRHILESLLEKGNVLLHINPQVKETIKLPPGLDDAYNVVLCIGYETPFPIPDLNLTEKAVEATLTASREQFHCIIPWKSIYYMGLLGDLGQGWPSDAPLALFHHWHARLAAPLDEVKKELENEGVSTVYEEATYPPKKKNPFTIISGDAEGASSPPTDSHFLTLLTSPSEE